MQSLHKNENLLFKDLQDFTVWSQQLPQNRIPFYRRWVNRFHEIWLPAAFGWYGKEGDRFKPP
jgi:hypothetical protein